MLHHVNRLSSLLRAAIGICFSNVNHHFFWVLAPLTKHLTPRVTPRTPKVFPGLPEVLPISATGTQPYYRTHPNLPLIRFFNPRALCMSGSPPALGRAARAAFRCCVACVNRYTREEMRVSLQASLFSPTQASVRCIPCCCCFCQLTFLGGSGTIPV